MTITQVAVISCALGILIGYFLSRALERRGRYIGDTINTAFSIKQEKQKP